MFRSLNLVALFSGALVLGAVMGMSSTIKPAHAGAMARPPHDPKKKSAGDACKSADECQKHQTCEKVGDKQVCKEPPMPSLPPGAVT